MGAKRTNGQSNHDVRKNGSEPVTRAEFDSVLRLLSERDQAIDELRGELRVTCREVADGVADDVRRELQTQFTRIAQIQQEIDELKRKNR